MFSSLKQGSLAFAFLESKIGALQWEAPISLRSIKNFVVTNVSLVTVGLIEYGYTLIADSVTSMYLFVVARNYALYNMIEYSAQEKEPITGNGTIAKAELKGFHTSLWSTSAIETGTLILSMGLFVVDSQSTLNELVCLIPVSFVYEVFFDLFFYVTHRGLHAIPSLYQRLHKVHHEFSHINPTITFYQHPVDLVITHMVPTLISLWIMSSMGMPVTALQFNCIAIYIKYTEIAGHLGKAVAPTSCFPQCIWLPRALGIELYSEDHYLHHSLNNCNYSKRFSLWDRLGGTYHPYKVE
jgi:sterol desaturase/sphingolipid hydroxylase (fatty acid hydroxylase superfamily)